MRVDALKAGLLTAALLVAACACAATPAAAGAADPALDWTACAGEGVPVGMECATAQVPVDWARPTGRMLALPLARLPGSDPDRRIGVVFAVPGGPGVSGVEELKRSGGTLTGLRERFDVVTFDPRNARSGLPPECGQPGPVQVRPADQVEYEAQAARNRAAVDHCRAPDPELIDHLDSGSVARDIEAVRIALGEQRLSLIANSYGGVPVAGYARLFPDRVRAAFLDGASPHLPKDQVDQAAYRGMEENFHRFADWCDADPGCALRGEDVPAVWQALIAAADRNPVPVPGRGPEAAYSGFDFTFHAAFFSIGAQWPEFAAAIARARRGDASGFADRLPGSVPVPKQPMFPLGAVVQCPDGLGYGSYQEYRDAADRQRALSPNFGGVLDAMRLTCTGWTGPVTDPPAPLPADDLPPFLGAGSWGDGATTEAAAAQVPGSVTVRVDGPGHVLYESGNRCVIAHADRYLIDLVLPARGTVCPPNPA
jgi:pimeloyl-ACP methyl ester carboxylesterase